MTHNFRLWALSFCSSTTCSASLGTWPLSPWPCWISTSRPPCISSSEMSPYHKFHSELSVYPNSWPPLLQEIKQSLSDCMAQLLLLLLFYFLGSHWVLSSGWHVLWPLLCHLQAAALHDHHESQSLHTACLGLFADFILNYIPITHVLHTAWLL